MRRSHLGSFFVVLTSLLLGSCGGGGAGSPAGPVGGPPQIQPSEATFYAGNEYTFTVGGGRAPYFISSSEPLLLPVPLRVDGNFFTVVPVNTGVIDTGLDPEELPVRTVIVTVRDAIGNTTQTGALRVAQNFLTGYGVFFNSNCPDTGTAEPAAFCSGGETLVQMSATIGGTLYGNREYRFEIVRGPLSFVNIGPNGPVPAAGTVGPGGTTWTTRTAHDGRAFALIRVNNNVGTQVAVIRVVDVATGASTHYNVTIAGTSLGADLTAIPAEFSLEGRDSATCGTGTGDFLVFDGVPPYTATSTFPSQLTVDPAVSNENPGRFRFSATNPFFCMDPGVIVITDATGRRVQVDVTTTTGSGDPPPSPMQFTPSSLTLLCGTSGTVIITGGGTAFTAASPDARILATVASRTLTITRAAGDPPGTPASPTPGTENFITYTVNVTDGTNVGAVGVSAPSNCPP